MIDIAAQIAEAKTGLVIAGALVVGVWVAIQAFYWIQAVIINNSEMRDQMERDANRR